MRVLIVDDEKHVRDAVRLLLPWRELEITEVLEAENGAEAERSVLEKLPDLVITDMMMPMKDGVQLMEWLRLHAPLAKTIVISGHNDFHWVRGTIQHGGIDYILKPIDRDQLIAAVTRALQLIRSEELERLRNQARNMEMNQLRPVFWNRTFSNLLTEPQLFSSIKEKMRLEFSMEEALSCQTAILDLEIVNPQVLKRFSFDRELLFFTLTNICNEIIGKDRNGFAFRNWNSSNEVVILFWQKLSAATDQIQRINAALLQTLGVCFDFGVGTVRSFPEQLTISYSEAQTALRQRNLLQENAWIHPFTKKETRAAALHLSDFEEALRLSVLSRNTDRMEESVNAWIDAASQLEEITLEHTELWRHEADMLFSRWREAFLPGETVDTPENGGRKPIPLDPHGRFLIREWGTEFTRELVRFAQIVGSRQQQKEQPIIYEIKKYIESHYNGNISLQEIANHFYLSREYISRKFKQELGENISEYLTKIRIEKAKVLLQNPAMKISRIAEMVGFQDEKYFSKVFKKMVGISPNEHRKEAE